MEAYIKARFVTTFAITVSSVPSSVPATLRCSVSMCWINEEIHYRCGPGRSMHSSNLMISKNTLLLSSVAKSCLTLCNPMDCSMPGFPVFHYLLEFAQIHVHWVGDAIQPSHPPSPPSPPALNLSQHQGRLFASGGQSIGVSASASVFPMNIQDWFPLELTGLTTVLSKGFSRVFSSTTVQKKQFFSAQPALCSNSHTHTWLLEKP